MTNGWKGIESKREVPLTIMLQSVSSFIYSCIFYISVTKITKSFFFLWRWQHRYWQRNGERGGVSEAEREMERGIGCSGHFNWDESRLTTGMNSLHVVEWMRGEERKGRKEKWKEKTGEERKARRRRGVAEAAKEDKKRFQGLTLFLDAPRRYIIPYLIPLTHTHTHTCAHTHTQTHFHTQHLYLSCFFTYHSYLTLWQWGSNPTRLYLSSCLQRGRWLVSLATANEAADASLPVTQCVTHAAKRVALIR